MMGYVTVGTDDVARARRFYGAFLPALGYGLEEGPEGLSYAFRERRRGHAAQPGFYVKPPFDGGPASAGNGAMTAFRAHSQRHVRILHAAGLAAGGQDEGGPGVRDAYGDRFYVGYLRDPDGNKIALYSDDRGEPGRGG